MRWRYDPVKSLVAVSAIGGWGRFVKVVVLGGHQIKYVLLRKTGLVSLKWEI